MTILQLITRRQYRGAEVFAAQLSEELLKEGHNVVLAGLYAPPSDKILSVNKAHNIDLSNKTARAIPYFSILRSIAQLINEKKVDVVQANSSDNLKYAVLSQKIFGWTVPIVFRNASVLSAWLRNDLHRKINRWLLLQTSAIACVSQLSKDDLHSNLALPDNLLHYLPIGTPIGILPNREVARQFLKTQINFSPDALLIIHVGAFSPEKNQHLLIELLHELPREINGQTIHLICVGEGALRKSIMRKAEDTGVADRTHFMGYRQDVPSFLSGADLFVLPSSIEGTPGVLLEAAIHEVAAVAYDVGAVRECFPPSAEEQIVPAQDFEKMRERVESLLENADHRGYYAKQTKAYVKDNFSINSVSIRFANLYESLQKH